MVRFRVASGLPLSVGMRTGRTVQHEDTPVTARSAGTVPQAPLVVTAPDAGVDLEALERALILFALQAAGGNRTRAARFLRLSRSALIYRMHKHGLSVPAQPGHRFADEDSHVAPRVRRNDS